MKKHHLLFIAAGVALLPVSCNKDNAGEEVFLYAYDGTKTSIGEDWKVSWTSTDKLSVFNAVAGGSDYSENCRFIIDGAVADNKFKKDSDGKSLKTDGESFDWYVCSPYGQYVSNPGGTKGGYTVAMAPTQNGYGSKSHLSVYDIMVGSDKNVANGSLPTVALRHVCTIMKFHITNNSGKAAAITGITLDASAGGEFITGSFSMDYENCSLRRDMGTSFSYLCDLTVSGATAVSNGSSVDLYMIVAPFSIPEGEKIKLTIKGGNGECYLEKTVPQGGVSFAAGEVNNANIIYKPSEVIFTETFGETPFASAKVAEYNKDGLITSDPNKENYQYSVSGNSSIANDNSILNPNWTSFIKGAAVKIVATEKTTSNSAIYIKGITVEPNTTYVFSYNKSKGKLEGYSDFNTTTSFKYRKGGTSSWTSINETSEAGTITQEFTTGDYTTLDIGVEATTRLTYGLTYTYYPAVDLFKLIKK